MFIAKVTANKKRDILKKGRIIVVELNHVIQPVITIGGHNENISMLVIPFSKEVSWNRINKEDLSSQLDFNVIHTISYQDIVSNEYIELSEKEKEGLHNVLLKRKIKEGSLIKYSFPKNDKGIISGLRPALIIGESDTHFHIVPMSRSEKIRGQKVTEEDFIQIEKGRNIPKGFLYLEVLHSVPKEFIVFRGQFTLKEDSFNRLQKKFEEILI